MSKKIVMEYVGKHKERIDREIERELSRRLAEVKEISPHLGPVIEAMQELSVGGKRLRGLLTILGFELSGGEANEEVIKAAAAMEIFHLGLLIHDDFMDRDDLRRGVVTIQARYEDRHLGESIAVLAGDYTFAWVTEILSNLKSPMTNSQIIKAIQVWGKYYRRVGYGQTLDVMTEQRGEVTEEEILSVLALKSGEYSCVLPLQLGATLAGAEGKLMQSLYDYGMELGWVFQLRDDYLAEWGESDKTGKPVGNDSREGKKTFATMYGRERLEQEISKHLEQGKGLTMGNEVLAGLLEWMATRES